MSAAVTVKKENGILAYDLDLLGNCSNDMLELNWNSSSICQCYLGLTPCIDIG